MIELFNLCVNLQIQSLLVSEFRFSSSTNDCTKDRISCIVINQSVSQEDFIKNRGKIEIIGSGESALFFIILDKNKNIHLIHFPSYECFPCSKH